MRTLGPDFFVGVFPMIHSFVSSVVRRFVRDERGATMVEYGLLVALVAVAVIGAVTALGGSINTFFETADNGLNGV
jgi:pilus assembly protein Flp/PilA